MAFSDPVYLTVLSWWRSASTILSKLLADATEAVLVLTVPHRH
jgi:hypothetical protein